MSLLISPKRGPKGSSVDLVYSVAYHRNGSDGESFFRVLFNNGRGQAAIALIAIVTLKTDKTIDQAYVIHPTDPTSAWQGTGHFGPALATVCNSCKWSHETKAKSVPLLKS